MAGAFAGGASAGGVAPDPPSIWEPSPPPSRSAPRSERLAGAAALGADGEAAEVVGGQQHAAGGGEEAAELVEEAGGDLVRVEARLDGGGEAEEVFERPRAEVRGGPAAGHEAARFGAGIGELGHRGGLYHRGGERRISQMGGIGILLALLAQGVKEERGVWRLSCFGRE
ncbi:MAG TPA: hypothetical protein VLT84_04205, partial [Acidobacteriota bacterium]|nr:hypothetical protein [Acidobacteriota bacterium]